MRAVILLTWMRECYLLTWSEMGQLGPLQRFRVQTTAWYRRPIIPSSCNTVISSRGMFCLSVQTEGKRAHCCVKPRQLMIAQGCGYCHSQTMEIRWFPLWFLLSGSRWNFELWLINKCQQNKMLLRFGKLYSFTLFCDQQFAGCVLFKKIRSTQLN